MAAAGFVPVCVWDTEEYIWSPLTAPAAKRNALHARPPVPLTQQEVLYAVFGIDGGPTVHFAPTTRLQDWGAHGVMLVPGNGRDLIADHVDHVGPFSDAVNRTLRELGILD
jgi:hypothetical protein